MLVTRTVDSSSVATSAIWTQISRQNFLANIAAQDQTAPQEQSDLGLQYLQALC